MAPGIRTVAAAPAEPSSPLAAASRRGGPAILVAGARTAAVHDLLEALLGGAGRLPRPPRRGFLVLHAPWAGVDIDFTGRWTHRPRRVDVAIDNPLLDSITLTAVRAVPAQDSEGHRLICELVEACGSVVLVTDGRNPYQPAEIDVLQAAMVRRKSIFLAITHADAAPAWPEVVRANQARLAHDFPDLVLAPWHPVTRSSPRVAELRERLLAQAGSSRAEVTVERRDPPVRVAADAVDSGWADLVNIEVAGARSAVNQFVDRELTELRAAIHRPAAATGDLGPAERLGLALPTLSVALSAEVRSLIDSALATVLGRVLADAPDARTLARVRAVLRRDVAERCSGLPACYRVLRVTATAAAAVATSREPVTESAGHADSVDAVLPPLGVGLTTNCLPVVRALASGSALGERDWVNRAVASLGPVLGLEMDEQFAHLRSAIEDLIAEGLDHDLLLV